MQVIFIKDLKNQGKKGEIKEVKDGYAQNFLIKNGYAVKKNDANMSILNKQKKEEKELDDYNRKMALDMKKKIESEKISFVVKTGEGDKVFGSVSAKQIKDKLDKYNISKNQIVIDSPLSSLGYHEVRIDLYKDIFAIVRVELKK
jgi:large subunit ribosomal protein L9